jgi:hypothetical protein
MPEHNKNRSKRVNPAIAAALGSILALGTGVASADNLDALERRIMQLNAELAATKAELEQAKLAAAAGADPESVAVEAPEPAAQPPADKITIGPLTIGGAMRVNYVLGDYPNGGERPEPRRQQRQRRTRYLPHQRGPRLRADPRQARVSLVPATATTTTSFTPAGSATSSTTAARCRSVSPVSPSAPPHTASHRAGSSISTSTSASRTTWTSASSSSPRWATGIWTSPTSPAANGTATAPARTAHATPTTRSCGVSPSPRMAPSATAAGQRPGGT